MHAAVAGVIPWTSLRFSTPIPPLREFSLSLLLQLQTTFPDRHPIVRSARLYAGKTVQGSVVEMHHRVEIGEPAFDNREFIVRYRTDVESGPVFHSDLNGLQASHVF